MDIKNPTTSCICCHTTSWNINAEVIYDKLQGSVATYLRCGGIVNNQIKRSQSCWNKKIPELFNNFLKDLKMSFFK